MKIYFTLNIKHTNQLILYINSYIYILSENYTIIYRSNRNDEKSPSRKITKNKLKLWQSKFNSHTDIHRTSPVQALLIAGFYVDAIEIIDFQFADVKDVFYACIQAYLIIEKLC